jgi:hypothetical protein
MSRIEIVIINGVGPFSELPVLLAIHTIALFTGMRMTSDQPMAVRRIYNAVRPEPALTRATVSASNVQPTMSLPTPALSTTIPIVVSSNFSSVRMRHCGDASVKGRTAVKGEQSYQHWESSNAIERLHEYWFVPPCSQNIVPIGYSHEQSKVTKGRRRWLGGGSVPNQLYAAHMNVRQRTHYRWGEPCRSRFPMEVKLLNSNLGSKLPMH